MLRAAQDAGFVVRHMFTVVDREQGAVATLRNADVDLFSIFTATELLALGVDMDFATPQQFEEARTYIANNQFNLGGSVE
jgi:orotate phosphoribosyltransferase